MSAAGSVSSRSELVGEVAVVTGAAQGIGRAVVEALLARGAAVAGYDVNLAPLLEIEAEATERDQRFVPCRCDVSRPSDLRDSFLRVDETLGPVSLLASVAGVLVPTSALSATPADWDRMLAVNATGPLYLVQEAASRMIPRRRGSIVAVASNAGRVPRLNLGAYAATKACAIHLFKCLGLELARHGIRCNTVSPGSTDTPMQRALWNERNGPAQVIAGSLADHRLGIPLGCLAEPDAIAEAVLFLLSPRAGNITLQDLCVDGGATLGV